MNENNNSSYSYIPDPKIQKTKRRGGAGKIIALALVCAILGGALGAGGILFYQSRQEKPVEDVMPVPTPGVDPQRELPEAPAEKPEEKAEPEEKPAPLEKAEPSTRTAAGSAVDVYEKNVASTVGIRTSVVTTNYWGQRVSGAAAGSGFIVSEDGYILTCYHVVEDATSISVSCYDGSEYTAQLMGYDSANDVAILKADAKGLTPVTVGDSDALKVGESVVAIGNPLGELTFSCTQGIISALNREIHVSSGNTMNLLQTDCAINSGNSGGALFNMDGQVIGITNAKYGSNSSGTSVDNLCFAIPMNQVIDIVNSIIEKGYISKPYIGITVTNVSEETQSYGYPAGAAVKEIVEGGPADEAGLEYNDIITAVDGTEVTGKDDLITYISKCSPGDEVVLTVFRQGEDDQLTITVEVGEKQVAAIEEQQTTESQPSGGFGSGGQRDSDDYGDYYGYGDDGSGWSFSFPFGNFGFNFGF